jgi:tetratricopeptide (TPR) repeat protein
MRKLAPLALTCLAIVVLQQTVPAQESTPPQTGSATAGITDREQDGLTGPVRRVRVETARFTVKDGKPVEGERAVRAMTTYDFQGKRVDNVAHPVDTPTTTGKEQYRYDDKGNIVEMVLRGENGAILSKETYQYEIDELGNWKKMTTSVAVYENGNVAFEPVEVTYRTITYYYNQAIDKLNSTPPVATSTVAAKMPAAAATKEAAPPAIESPVVKHDPAPVVKSEPPVVKNDPPAVVQPVAAVKEATPEPNAASFYEQGVAHIRAGRHEQAVTALKQAVYLNPEDGSAYAKLGIAYASTGQHKEALAAFKLAIKIKPDAMDTEANYRMAESFTGTGKFKEALEAYKQALYTKRAENVDGSKATQFPTMADIHFGLGLAYYNRESFSDAIKELKQAATLEPNSVDIQYGIALAYLASGDRSSAQRQEKILRPLDPALADNIAAALSNATPPGITRIQPREDRRMRP